MQTAADLNVRDHGAIGDGQADDTAAIQAAIDAAAAIKGSVFFPAGTYRTGTLRLQSNVALIGVPTWGYRDNGGTILKLRDPADRILIDMTGSLFCRITGLSLLGECEGTWPPVYPDDSTATIGIYHDGTGHKCEESLVIDNVRVAWFSGHGIQLDNVWGWTVRQSMVIFNGGDGLRYTRWDGWIMNSIFNNCAGYAIHGCHPNGAVTIVGNRIEWCFRGGIHVEYGGNYHINSNYFDRNGGPGIYLQGHPDYPRATFAVTGNLLKRNGAKADPESENNCHIRLEHIAGAVVHGNTCATGANDSGDGAVTPAYGFVLSHLQQCVIRDNVLFHGFTRDHSIDHGHHDDHTLIRDNPGSLLPPPPPDAKAE